MSTAPQTTPFNGHFRLLNPDGSESESSDARFELEPEALVVQPKAQPVLRIDFADVDALEPGDYVATLLLESGDRVEVSMLGRRFGEFGDALASLVSTFQAKNLLLEEPLGGEQFTCEVERERQRSEAQVRVYATSLAIIPKAAVPYSVPFGELTAVGFDEDRYAIDLTTRSGRISLGQLGRQAQPCLRLIEARLAELRKRTAAALAFLVPQVPSLTARKLAQALADGVPARRGDIDALSPSIWPDLVKASTGSKELKACFDALAALCPAGEIAIGIKETNARQDDETEAAAEAEEPEAAEAAEPEAVDAEAPESEPEAEETGGEGGPMDGRVVWFAFPILDADRKRPGNAVAVEAVTRGGRATYLFRIAPPEVYRDAPFEEVLQLARERIRSVSRAMVALTFKREPIYLADDKIRTGRYARHRLALRISAPLKSSRATFLGRAIHGPAWRRQIDAALAKARG